MFSDFRNSADYKNNEDKALDLNVTNDFSNFLTDPYSLPNSSSELSHNLHLIVTAKRSFPNRPVERSDSEFSDCSVDSTDCFVRRRNFWHDDKRSKKTRRKKNESQPKEEKNDEHPSVSLPEYETSFRRRGKRFDADGRSFYVKDDVLPFDESSFDEFKAHRCFAFDELSEKQRGDADRGIKRTCKAISTVLNGMLNAGEGGITHIGVTDCGRVIGMMLSDDEVRHCRGQLKDLFSRFVPPVPQSRYAIRFIPVLEGIDLEAEISSITSFLSRCSDEDREGSSSRPHIFRNPNYCWCSSEAAAKLNFGRIQSLFVIEIEIFPWRFFKSAEDEEDDEDIDEVLGLRLPPVHQDEKGELFIRQNAQTVEYKVSDVLEFQRQRVNRHLTEMMQKLSDVDEN